jgi:predicted Rossmann fold flavoprotein
MEKFDVIVVGAGAAGLMAAGQAARRGRTVLLLEKNRRVGEKLRLTGGGRCNLAYAEFDPRAWTAHFGDKARFLHSAFARFSTAETFDFFEDLGLELEVEDDLRVFPQSRKAEDVVEALLRHVRKGRVDLRTQTPVNSIDFSDSILYTAGGAIHFESLVLATGGLAYPRTGSTGDGLRWLEKWGHTILEGAPDLVPLRVREKWVKNLSGTSLSKMKLTLHPPSTSPFVIEGSLLFTHFGLSGPTILNHSTRIRPLLKKSGSLSAFLDLLPEMSFSELETSFLQRVAEHPKKLLRNLLPTLLPSGMFSALEAHIPESIFQKRAAALLREERKLLLERIKALPLTITGTMGYDWAIVSAGGVPLSEVDPRTMASRLYPNLFIVGDLLEVPRPCGGFSLQLCWTSGWLAGEHA